MLSSYPNARNLAIYVKTFCEEAMLNRVLPILQEMLRLTRLNQALLGASYHKFLVHPFLNLTHLALTKKIDPVLYMFSQCRCTFALTIYSPYNDSSV